MREPVGQLLVVDADIADVVEALLSDDGYSVTTLHDRDLESLRAAVDRFRSDCVLPDGAVAGVSGESWADAARLAAMPAPVR